jgi:molybdopterin-guanine dinucleotide biosynthesis protein A
MIRGDVAAAILAGGQASRMGGRAKSFLVVDGARVIDRQLAVLRTLARELVIVANDAAPYAPLGLPVVPDGDEHAGQGPLAGILAALEATRAAHVLVVACDMPFLDAPALARLVEAADDADVAVAVGARPEPLCARYSRRCVPVLRHRLVTGQRRATDLLDDPALRVTRITYTSEERRFLTNVNTPSDLGSL